MKKPDDYTQEEADALVDRIGELLEKHLPKEMGFFVILGTAEHHVATLTNFEQPFIEDILRVSLKVMENERIESN